MRKCFREQKKRRRQQLKSHEERRPLPETVKSVELVPTPVIDVTKPFESLQMFKPIGRRM